MKDTLRLLLTEKCNRSCVGCCNKDWDMNKIPVCTDYSGYKIIAITGGEPMLYADWLPNIMKEIKEQNPTALIVIYTADFEYQKISYLMGRRDCHPDGLTVTLHSHGDLLDFYHAMMSQSLMISGSLANQLHKMIEEEKKYSLRLNVFKGIKWELLKSKIPDFEKFWKVKSNMVWIKDCPLPKNEVFMRYNW